MTASQPPSTGVAGNPFVAGTPTSPEEISVVVEQYKLMLQTTESLQGRRQTLHTFFMSINSVLLAAIGLIGKESLDTPAVGMGVIVLGATGVVMSLSWRQQLDSYGVVAASKWQVINQIECALPSRPFCAEYQRLEGKNYRSFTQAERNVPGAFALLYAISMIIVGVLMAVEVF